MSTESIPELPLLKPWYRVAETATGVAFEYGQGVVVFEGDEAARLLPPLFPLLDGTRSVDEIVAPLGDEDALAARHALGLLSDHGLLAEGEPAPSAAPRAGTATLLAATSPGDRSPTQVHSALVAARVAFVGSSGLGAELARCLRLSGVRSVEQLDWDASDESVADTTVYVAAPSAAELPRVASWNRRMIGANTPWLPVLPFDGRSATIGPLVVPRETCCYECVQLRRAGAIDWAPEYWALEQRPASYPDAPALDRAVAGVAAWLLLRWIVSGDGLLPGALHTLEYATRVELRAHVVYRVPRCPACSGLEESGMPLPWHEAMAHEHA